MFQVILVESVPVLSNLMKFAFLNFLKCHRNKFIKAKFTVKCISRSVLASGPSHATKDSKRKLLSASKVTIAQNASVHQNIWMTWYVYWNVIIV